MTIETMTSNVIVVVMVLEVTAQERVTTMTHFIVVATLSGKDFD
jgi:hypothetical protein